MIIIKEYDPQWVLDFQKEKELLLSDTSKSILDIEHIGSTSVPGLGAKPILDIMAGVNNLGDIDKALPFLEKTGYQYVSKYESIMPFRKYFTKQLNNITTHHLHIVELTHEFWNKHLLFRDYLRNNSETMQQYYLLKKELAVKFADDRGQYTNAKSDFINSILDKAKNNA